MELLSGPSLREELDLGGAFAPPRALAVLGGGGRRDAARPRPRRDPPRPEAGQHRRARVRQRRTGLQGDRLRPGVAEAAARGHPADAALHLPRHHGLRGARAARRRGGGSGRRPVRARCHRLRDAGRPPAVRCRRSAGPRPAGAEWHDHAALGGATGCGAGRRRGHPAGDGPAPRGSLAERDGVCRGVGRGVPARGGRRARRRAADRRLGAADALRRRRGARSGPARQHRASRHPPGARRPGGHPPPAAPGPAELGGAARPLPARSAHTAGTASTPAPGPRLRRGRQRRVRRDRSGRRAEPAPGGSGGAADAGPRRAGWSCR